MFITTRRRKSIFKRLLGDNRGSEMLETIAKVAFIALPILAIIIYSFTKFSTKYTTEGTAMKGEADKADTSKGNALKALE